MVSVSSPLIIQNALTFFVPYLSTHAVKYGRSGARHRGMRSDRKNNLLSVVSVMLRGCSLQHNGVICHFSGLWVRPMTLAEIATLTQICPKTVSRCIADLVDLGLVKSTQIKRKNRTTGRIEVSIGIRQFTKKFWKALGLWEFFEKSCQWAKEHGCRKLILPFKGVSVKVKSTMKQAGKLVEEALQDLSNSTICAQQWCNKIRENIRKNK